MIECIFFHILEIYLLQKMLTYHKNLMKEMKRMGLLRIMEKHTPALFPLLCAI